MSLAVPAAVAIIGIGSESGAVPLDNWRFPWYDKASLFGYRSTPSAFFWDDLNGVPAPCDTTLAPGTGRFTAGRWIFEPSVAGALETNIPGQDRPGQYRINALNDITYGPVTARQVLDVDSRYAYDTFYPAHREREARGRIAEAYLQADYRYGFARLGRLDRNWGPFPGRSLFLSNNPYSFDAVEWQIRSKLFEFRDLFALLPTNDHTELEALDDAKTGRFFVAHALALMPMEDLSLGIFESMVFQRSTGFPDLQYVNPFSIYTVLNTNQEGNGNLMLGFQWRWEPCKKRIGFSGQIALDDFQVDHTSITDQEPNHWGIDCALFWRDPLRLDMRHVFEAGYNRRSEWLYTVPDANADNGERYTYLGKSLGFPANDGDRVWMGMTVLGKPWLVCTVTGAYERQGDKNPLSRWNDSIPGLPFDFREKQFPSGTVTTACSAAFELLASYRNWADTRISIDNRWISDTTGEFGYHPRFSATFTLHYCNFLIPLP